MILMFQNTSNEGKIVDLSADSDEWLALLRGTRHSECGTVELVEHDSSARLFKQERFKRL
jgi:hypothetical protein